MQESYANLVEEVIARMVETIVTCEPDLPRTAAKADALLQCLFREIGSGVYEKLLNATSRQVTDQGYFMNAGLFLPTSF